MKSIFKYASLLLLASVFSGSSNAEEGQWSNWRGPNYDGSSTEATPPVSWDAETNIRWKTAVPGKGSSTPVLWGDRLFLTTAIDTGRSPTGQQPTPTPESNESRGGRGGMNNPQPTTLYEFVVLAYDKNSGDEIWRTVVRETVPHEPGHATNTFASGSCVTDGQHVYASFGSNGIFCLTIDGGKVWDRDLGKMRTRNSFGEGASPALHGDTLIVPWDHDGYTDANGNGTREDGELDSAVFALDAKTGEVRWDTKRSSEPTTWATPLIVEFEGKAQVILNGTTVRSYQLSDGKEIWSCGGQVTNPIPCPVRYKDSVICMTGYRGNAVYALPLSAMGDITATNYILWNRDDVAPYVSSPTLYEGRLYYTKSRDGIMTSVDASSGEVVIPQSRIGGIRDIYAAPVAAADKVYFTSREGVTTVIKHADEYQELSTNRLGEPVDASPILDGDAIYLRGAEHLFCIGE